MTTGRGVDDLRQPFGDPVEGLEVVTRESVLELTISRPERRNALTPDLIHGLTTILDKASERDDLRAVLLTGAGSKAFCAGFDIAHIGSQGSKESGLERDLVDELATKVANVSLPVVAAINGVAVGAGCDLAIACDIRLGTPATRFGMPPAKLGLLYGWRGIDRLIHAVGFPAAKEMLLTGDLIPAERAYDIGLLSRIVPADELGAATRHVTDALAANAPLSVAGSKRIVNILATRQPLTDAENAELAAIQQRVWHSGDALEGARAHRERRPPQFKGE
jgi:enoyl-CoA hydratase/carnithine racemase